MPTLRLESSKYTSDGLRYDIVNSITLGGNVLPFTTTANVGSRFNVSARICPFSSLYEQRTVSQTIPINIDSNGVVGVYDEFFDAPYTIQQDWNSLDDSDTLTIYKNTWYATGIQAVLNSASGPSGSSITFNPPSSPPTKWTLTQSGGVQVAKYNRCNIYHSMRYDNRNDAPVYKIGLQATLPLWEQLEHEQTYTLGEIVELIGAQWVYCGGLASTSPRIWGGYCSLGRNFA